MISTLCEAVGTFLTRACIYSNIRNFGGNQIERVEHDYMDRAFQSPIRTLAAESKYGIVILLLIRRTLNFPNVLKGRVYKYPAFTVQTCDSFALPQYCTHTTALRISNAIHDTFNSGYRHTATCNAPIRTNLFPIYRLFIVSMISCRHAGYIYAYFG